MAKTRSGVVADESGTTDSEICGDVNTGSDSGTTTKPRSKKAGADRMATTRGSLLIAIKDPKNRQSWVEFFDIYCPFIARIGKYQGLDADLADDLVIIVMREVNKNIATFDYNDNKFGFRSWIKTVAIRKAISIWRVENPLPKPKKPEKGKTDLTPKKPSADKIPAEELRKQANRKAGMTPSTFEPEKVPDTDNALEAMWEREDKEAILKIACRITKEQVKQRQWQLFERRVMREWPVERICATLGVTANVIHIAKTRINPIYKEACIEARKRLDRGPLSPLDRKALEDTLPLPSYAKSKAK